MIKFITSEHQFHISTKKGNTFLSLTFKTWEFVRLLALKGAQSHVLKLLLLSVLQLRTKRSSIFTFQTLEPDNVWHFSSKRLSKSQSSFAPGGGWGHVHVTLCLCCSDKISSWTSANMCVCHYYKPELYFPASSVWSRRLQLTLWLIRHNSGVYQPR